ncbi:hypothetical protein ACH5RR_040833 [Cinchona calisaya]|uniref:Profilin n=1 Tax=Cinchona calisaya TaxID=153742 RepID=A0ABD2XUE5_9GENT
MELESLGGRGGGVKGRDGHGKLGSCHKIWSIHDYAIHEAIIFDLDTEDKKKRFCLGTVECLARNHLVFGHRDMDWAFVHKIWEKWASNSVGSPGLPLKAALLINYDPTGPSRLLSTIAEQEGIRADPMELSQFISFIKRNKLQNESFFIGQNQYLVTSIHESWFSARCMNTSKPAGEGAIVMQTSSCLLVGLYDGSIGSASRAMVAVDQFALQLTRRNL